MLFKKKLKNLIRFDCREVYKSDCNDCRYYGNCNKLFISNVTLNNLCVVGSPKSMRHIVYLVADDFKRAKCYSRN